MVSMSSARWIPPHRYPPSDMLQPPGCSCVRTDRLSGNARELAREIQRELRGAEVATISSDAGTNVAEVTARDIEMGSAA